MISLLESGHRPLLDIKNSASYTGNDSCLFVLFFFSLTLDYPLKSLNTTGHSPTFAVCSYTS